MSPSSGQPPARTTRREEPRPTDLPDTDRRASALAPAGLPSFEGPPPAPDRPAAPLVSGSPLSRWWADGPAVTEDEGDDGITLRALPLWGEGEPPPLPLASCLRCEPWCLCLLFPEAGAGAGSRSGGIGGTGGTGGTSLPSLTCGHSIPRKKEWPLTASPVRSRLSKFLSSKDTRKPLREEDTCDGNLRGFEMMSRYASCLLTAPAAKGTWPVASSNKRQPSAHQSTAFVIPSSSA